MIGTSFGGGLDCLSGGLVTRKGNPNLPLERHKVISSGLPPRAVERQSMQGTLFRKMESRGMV